MQSILKVSTEIENAKDEIFTPEVTKLAGHNLNEIFENRTGRESSNVSSEDWMQMYSRRLEDKVSLFILESIVAKRMELLIWIDQLTESPNLKNYENLLNIIADRLPDERKSKQAKPLSMTTLENLEFANEQLQTNLDKLSAEQFVSSSSSTPLAKDYALKERNNSLTNLTFRSPLSNKLTTETAIILNEYKVEEQSSILQKQKIVFGRNEDLISHILCRYAFCMSDKWRKWFVKNEEILMRARIKMEVLKRPFTFLVALMKENGLPCLPLTVSEKNAEVVQEYVLYRSSLGEFSKESEAMINNYYSVPLSLTTRLTKIRKVLCYNGKGILYRDQVEEVFIAVYRGKLYKNLHEAYLLRVEAEIPHSSSLHNASSKEHYNSFSNNTPSYSSSSTPTRRLVTSGENNASGQRLEYGSDVECNDNSIFYDGDDNDNDDDDDDDDDGDDNGHTAEETAFSRLMTMLDTFVKCFIEESTEIVSEGNVHSFRACDVHRLAETHFPLCMRQIDEHLRSMHHLKHNGRFTFSLFLKAIGLSLEESMSYFASLMTEKTNNRGGNMENFEKSSYGYNIRHNYGLEGKKTSYTSASCATLLSLPPIIDKYDCHGCPFRFQDEHAFRKMLTTAQRNPINKDLPNISPTIVDVEDIIQDCKGQHYTRACYKYFLATHPNARRDTLFRSPYEYFHTSIECEKRSDDNSLNESRNDQNMNRLIAESESFVSVSSNNNLAKQGTSLTTKRQINSLPLREDVTRFRKDLNTELCEEIAEDAVYLQQENKLIPQIVSS